MTDSRNMVQRVLTRKWAGSSVAQSAALMRWLSEAAREMGSAGKHIYVVGGAVRNFVLNQPIKDVDMVVDSLAMGGKDASWVAQSIARRIPTPTKVWTDNLMVSHIEVKGPWVLDGHEMEGEEIEIVNARKEVYETDENGNYVGHKPIEVSPTTLEDDVKRREFTFNTLMWRLIDLAEGPDKAEIIDLTGCGLRDLDNRVMECPRPPDETFKEDPTRILRIIKFAFKYGFKLTKDTEAAARRQAKGLKRIPSKTETVLKQIVLDSPHYKKALGVMDDLGVLEVIKEMMRENPKTFGSFMQNNAKSKGFAYMFDLMDVGLPVGQDVSFLNSREQARFREIALSMPQSDAEAFRDGLKNPGNVYKDKRFFVDLARELGLGKKNMGVLSRQLSEAGREALLRDPSLIKQPRAFKEHLRRVVLSGAGKRASLLPIMSPWFNVREVIKQCVLLEDHLFHPQKRCPDCIAKHFLTIEAFLEEATTLDSDGSLDFDASQMAGRIRLLQMAWVDGVDERWVAQAVRGVRKNFRPVELLGVREASIDHIVERSVPCPHALMKTAGFKRWLAGLLAKATAVKAVYDWGTEEVEGVSTPLGSLQPKGFIWQIGSQWFGTSNFINHIRFRSEDSAIRAIRFDKVATKTHAQNEDEQTSKLVKKSPKKKPPRKDLRKERVDVEADPDIEDLGAEGDDDLSLNYKRIAARWLFARIEKTDGGKWKATKGDKSEYFHSESDAQAWLEDKDPDAENTTEGEEGEAPPEETSEGGGGKPERVEINGPDDIPEDLQGLLDYEAFNDGEGKPLKGLFISGPAEGRYTISVEHVDGTTEEVSVDPMNEDDLDHLISFPEEVARNSEVKTKAVMTKQRDTRKKLHKRMEKLLPELAEKLPSENFIDSPDFDHAAFDAAYDKEMAAIKANPMPIGEARVSLNGEAAAELFDGNEETPVAELLGEIMARAEYAKDTHFNPSKDLSKPGVKGDLTKDERFAQVSSIMEDSQRHTWSDREVLVLSLQAERETLDDDDKRAKEIDARIEGHQLAAVIKEHKMPGGEEPGPGVKTFVRKLAETEDGRAVLCTPNEEWGTPESREAMKSAMAEVPDEHFHELFEEGSAAGHVAELVALGRDPDERKQFREMATEIHMDSMTVYEPLLAMRDTPLSDKERDDYQKQCGELVRESKEKLDNGKDSPSGILDWLRQMLSGLVSTLFGEKSERDGDSAPETTLLSNKVREHAEKGQPDTLSQKTDPPPRPLFGGKHDKEK